MRYNSQIFSNHALWTITHKQVYELKLPGITSGQEDRQWYKVCLWEYWVFAVAYRAIDSIDGLLYGCGNS